MSEADASPAVALIRIPDWEPPDELDVRELDDAVLLFLEIPFGDDDSALLDALEDALGDPMYEHEEERGVFFFPDHAEPDEASTYDEVIAAVGDQGRFLQFGGAALAQMNELLEDPQALMQQVFGAMGIDDPATLLSAMQGGDPEALKLAQIQVTGALERAMQRASVPQPNGVADASAERVERASDAEPDKK